MKLSADPFLLRKPDSGYLDTWDSVSFDDKWRVVDLMITTVAAASDSLNIIWKI